MRLKYPKADAVRNSCATTRSGRAHGVFDGGADA